MLVNLSKNTVVYCFLRNKKLFSLVLSSFKGWGIFTLKSIYVLLKNKTFYFFATRKKSIISLLASFFLGFQKGYFNYLKLKGMGFKFKHFKDSLFLKFGFSHRLVYSTYVNVYCLYINRYLICLGSRSFWDLIRVKQFFANIRKNNVYKKKGIFLKGSLIDIKLSSKKSKF